MRQKRMAAYLCMAVLLTVTGCGNTDSGQSVKTMDMAGENVQTDENVSADPDYQKDVSEENDSNSESGTSDVVSEEPVDKQADISLDGIVVSVGDNSVVVSEMVKESTEDTEVMFVAEASEGESVTVYFSENTQFEHKTVKNNGVNGDEDVERREGSLADINEGTVLNMTGSYQGDDFYAEQVVIYKFV